MDAMLNQLYQKYIVQGGLMAMLNQLYQQYINVQGGANDPQNETQFQEYEHHEQNAHNNNEVPTALQVDQIAHNMNEGLMDAMAMMNQPHKQYIYEQGGDDEFKTGK